MIKVTKGYTTTGVAFFVTFNFLSKERVSVVITLNGEKINVKEGMTIAELIKEKQFRINLVAVEYNGQIPSKSELDKIVLKDGDTIEVVAFMGGG